MTTTTTDWTVGRTSATLAAVGLAGIVLFQLALALGAPLGRAAWGGIHPGALPTGLRIASGLAIAVWSFAALLVLRRGGLGLSGIPEALARWGTWTLVGLLLLGAAMNFASSSPWERYLWSPHALVLAGLCFLAARAA